VLWLSLQPGPTPRAWHEVDRASAKLYARLHRHALANGLWLAPSAFEVAFLSTAHGPAEIHAIAVAFERALAAAVEER
jgi:glutamate-1-semialdehyde 2,1-aminomutase